MVASLVLVARSRRSRFWGLAFVVCAALIMWALQQDSVPVPREHDTTVGTAEVACVPEGSGTTPLVLARSLGALPLTGSVSWQDGVPMTDAEITVRGTAVQARVDKQGNYLLPQAVMRGMHEAVLVVRPGCWMTAKEVTAGVHMSADGLSMTAESIEMPVEMDLVVDVRFDEDVARVLQQLSYEGLLLRVRDGEAPRWRAPVIVADEATLEPKVRFTVRCQFVPSVWLAVLCRSASNELTNVEQGTLAADRGSIATYECVVGSDRMIHGVVVDHEGAPLPEASLELRLPDDSLADGFARDRSVLSPAARFVFMVAPDQLASLAVSFGGIEKVLHGVQPGSSELRVHLDVRKLHRLVVQSAGVPIESYRLAAGPVLFAATRLPDLPRHDDGKSWVPMVRSRRDMSLAWRDGGQYYESRVMIDAETAGQRIIDVIELVAEPCGSVVVDFGEVRDVNVHIERDEVPEQCIVRYAKLIGWPSSGVGLRGIPPGLYKVELRAVRGWLGQGPQLVHHVRVAPGAETRIDVAALLGR